MVQKCVLASLHAPLAEQFQKGQECHYDLQAHEGPLEALIEQDAGRATAPTSSFDAPKALCSSGIATARFFRAR